MDALTEANLSALVHQRDRAEHQRDAALARIEILRTESAKWRRLLYEACSLMLTCHEENTDEWMSHLVAKLNDYSAHLGDKDRFIYRDTRGNGWIEKKVTP